MFAYINKNSNTSLFSFLLYSNMLPPLPNVTMSQHGPLTRTEIQEEREILSDTELLLQQQERELEIVKELREDEDWIEVVSHAYLTPSAHSHSLTANSLRGENKILRRPLKFLNVNKTQCVVVVHLGDHLCGLNGVLHGGLLATLLDEQLAYVTLPHLPGKTGFTANLDINYHHFLRPNQWVIVRGKLDHVEGRKGYAEAWIEDLEGVRVAEAKSLYISPRV
ncbi:HotDog domain-containing protein [Pilobolus umbonatus]|nr:HotDog domain-containing protein [Pilobolus umbonatus]